MFESAQKIKIRTIEPFLVTLAGIFCLATPCHALRVTEGEGWQLDTSAGVVERYDDNITYRNTDKLSDMITEPGVSAQFKSENKSQVIKLDGALKYPYYHRHDELSHLKTSFGAELAKELSKYDRILVTERFDSSEEPKDFRDTFGRVIERAAYARNRAELKYTRELSRIARARLDLFSEWNNFSVEPLNDSGWHGIELQMARDIAGGLEIYAGGGWDVRHFVDLDEAHRISLFAGAKKELTHAMRLHGRVGVDLIEDYRGENLSEPFVTASLENDWDERTQSRLNFTSRHETNAFVQDIFDAWEVRGSLSRELSQRAHLSGEVFYGEGEYTVSGRQDDFTGVSLGLAYDIKKDVTFEVEAARTELSSSNDEDGYTKNTISAGLKVKI